MDDNKKYNILIDNIDKIADSFELNDTFWNGLNESGIFPGDYINYMKEQDIECFRKKKCIIVDIKRRQFSCPGSYAKFSKILRDNFNSNILDYYAKSLEEDAYSMVSPVPGYCLIINNQDFSKSVFPKRDGSEKDVKKFEAAFERLNYEVVTEQNLNKEQMELLFEQKSKCKKLKDHDIFVAVIMSHGITERVVTSDSKYISFEDILNYFSDEKCIDLAGKPKVLIFNCCRSENNYDFSDNKIGNNKKGTKNENPNTFGDILIIFSTLDKYKSVRDINLGTWFADAFVKAMEENPKDDIQQITVKANKILDDWVKNTETNTVETRQTIEHRAIGQKKSKFFFK